MKKYYGMSEIGIIGIRDTSLGKKTLKLCQCDSSFDSELCFDSEIRLAFENRFYSERVVFQSEITAQSEITSRIGTISESFCPD